MTQKDGETRELGGEVFQVRMLDPLTANELLIDLTKTLGPAFAPVISGIVRSPDSAQALSELLDGLDESEEKNDDTESTGRVTEPLTAIVRAKTAVGDGLERGIEKLVDRLEKEKLREIIDLLANVSCIKKGNDWPSLKTVFPVVFQGRIKLMYQWLFFAIRVQYMDFF